MPLQSPMQTTTAFRQFDRRRRRTYGRRPQAGLAAVEARLAALLYQAPSEIIGGLSYAQAEQINTLLRSTGLDSQVLATGERFTPGDASHEVALAIKNTENMAAIAGLIMDVPASSSTRHVRSCVARPLFSSAMSLPIPWPPCVVASSRWALSWMSRSRHTHASICFLVTARHSTGSV